MLRSCRKTEIYSVSMIDGKRALLLSDEGMNLEITPAGTTLGAGKAYTVVRESGTTSNPGVYSQPTALYEITLDGSNRTRRLFEMRPYETPPLLNRQAEKAVFGGFLDGKYMVLVYDVSTWNLIHSWDLRKLTEKHCPVCTPTFYGWLADGNRLFFSVSIDGDDNDEEAEKRSVPGTYIAADDGTDLGAIPTDAGQLAQPGYTRWSDYIGGEPPFLIGQMPDGDYLFLDHAVQTEQIPKRPISPDSFLVITAPDFKSKKQIALQLSNIEFPFYLSSSGKYLAYVEDRQTPNYRSGRHLWGLDLESGAKKELLATPPPPPGLPTSPEPNEVFTLLGWLDSK